MQCRGTDIILDTQNNPKKLVAVKNLLLVRTMQLHCVSCVHRPLKNHQKNMITLLVK